MEITEIQTLIAENPAVLLYFYNDHCAPCQVLRPKVQALLERDFPLIEFLLIDAEQNAATTAQYGVFASPALVVFFDGKEYIRESKNISIYELHDKIERIYRLIF